ncbi:MAG: oligosaccharide flippase family protein [Candidatus ainarchaeum sp.]|nr:oligosaccharide flippase family protein [Candidatus ainarchaeum sp.]
MTEEKLTKKGFILNSSKVLFSTLFLNFFGIIQGIVVANLLGPGLFGVKNALQMILDYGSNIHLGSLKNFSKKRQTYEFSNLKKRDYFTNLTFTFLFLVSLLSMVAGIIAFFVLSYSLSTRLSVLILGFLIPIYLYCSFFGVILQSKSDFKTIFKTNILQGIVVILFVVAFVELFGVPGFFFGTLLGLIIVLLYQYFFVKSNLKLVFNVKGFILLIRGGFWVFLLSLMYLIFFGIDRVFILFGYGGLELGYYAVGLFFGSIIYLFINTLLVPFVPQIYQNLSKLDLLKKLIIAPTKIIACFSYFIAFLVLFLLPFIIFILPEYGLSTEYINILVFSMLFFPVLITNYYIGKNKELFLIKVSTIFIILIVLLNCLVLFFELRPVFIAYTTMLSIFFYGLTVNYFGYKELLGSKILALKEVFNYLFPFFYGLVGYGLLWFLAHFWLYGFINYYIVKIIQAVLFTTWYLPILWRIEKEHRIWRLILDYFKGKMNKKIKIEVNNI